jgi:hypothetical protein
MCMAKTVDPDSRHTTFRYNPVICRTDVVGQGVDGSISLSGLGR